jgi:hypothetical protein
MELEEDYTLDEARQYCSEYIRKHFGDQYDNTPWWDKWQIYNTLKKFKQKEIEDGQVRYFRQNEQETKT